MYWTVVLILSPLIYRDTFRWFCWNLTPTTCDPLAIFQECGSFQNLNISSSLTWFQALNLCVHVYVYPSGWHRHLLSSIYFWDRSVFEPGAHQSKGRHLNSRGLPRDSPPHPTCNFPNVISVNFLIICIWTGLILCGSRNGQWTIQRFIPIKIRTFLP